MDAPQAGVTRTVLARVRPEWVDHYGHMNLAYYVAVFDMATDVLWPRLLLGETFRRRGLGTFAAENWVSYRREVRLDDPLAAESEVLEHDSKRLLVRHRLLHAEAGFESARCELLFLCVDLSQRRVCLWPEDVAGAFAAAPRGAAPERLALRPVRST
ncbi:thioesterase family protein [Roseomonas sp. SSH11]|uniref:Thioesterase family protein n=1 Tax=Pararoseomonas baculiformis TaxID=2820812 RepID=A0ABS4AGT9_9PROT|nr:thioesterase family protein [Pararoseomonas baculiformis]MBP0446096.1 thioesterase family protein [Pararoseomonas baculiformis]